MTARLAVVALAAALALPGTAQADHLAPSVTVKLELVRKARECGRNAAGHKAPCGFRGAYIARLSWSASCGSDPSASAEIKVYTRVVRRGGRLGATYSNSSPDARQGEETVFVRPGTRLRPGADVDCSTSTTTAEGDTVSHTARAVGSGADVFVRPHLDGYDVPKNTVCNVRLPLSKLSTVLQARQWGTLAWGLRFSEASMLTPGSLTRRLRQIRLHVRGVGLRSTASPKRAYLRTEGYTRDLRPRRGGRMRIWATVGGVATNKISVRVLRAGRGCA